MWKDKRVLVTGASGVIGQPLVSMLLEAGADVLSVDIKDTVLDVNHVKTDLSRTISHPIYYEFLPQVVFHLAAVFERTVESSVYWEHSFEHNVLASHRLLQAMLDIGTVETFVFASSYLIYDPVLYLDKPYTTWLKETDEIRPRNIVGAAKLLFEQELETIDSFRTVSARIFRVYGRGSRDVISRWVRSALDGDKLEIFGRQNEFDYIFADDVATGLLRMAENSACKNIINLGSGKSNSIDNVVRILEASIPLIDKNYMHSAYPKESSAADMSRFRNLTGWIPQTSLERGMTSVISYELGRTYID